MSGNKNSKHVLEDLAYSQTSLFHRRVERAEQIVAGALGHMQNPYVACSWGKDSLAMLHLVREQRPDVSVVFINQGYACPLTEKYGVSCGEWPDTFAIRDRLVHEWKLNFVELHPPCVCTLQRRYGVPYTGSGDWEIDKHIYNDLIWQPVRNAIKKHGFDCCFMGLRAEESRARRITTHRYGPVTFVKGFKIIHAYPLADWSSSDVWAYLASRGLPHNSIYDKELPPTWTRETIRNAPWMTTYRIVCQLAWRQDYLVWLKRFFPGYWNMFRAEFPEAATFA